MLPGAGRFVPPESRGGRASNLRVTAPPYHRTSQPREVPLNQLLEDVLDPKKRGPALIHLATRRKTIPDFSLIVWRTPAIVTLILQEILSIYPYIHQEQIPEDVCHRVSCAISLFQPVALDGRVRDGFLRAEIPQYLHPLMNNPRQSTSFEKLRITSLGIIGFLVKESDLEAVQFLLRSEVVPLCLHCMEVGTVLSKTVAVFILEKLLSTEIGLEYICENQERFLATNQMLASMFTTLPHVEFGSHGFGVSVLVVCSYFQLVSSDRLEKFLLLFFYLIYCVSGITLYNLLPDTIRNGSCLYMFQDDTEIQNCAYQLLCNLGFMHLLLQQQQQQQQQWY